MRILIADDEATSRLITEMALQNLGHEHRSVTDGALAWEDFLCHRPDVVISDWLMPGLTGLQLCRKVRAHTPGSYTYFIMVTRRGAIDDVLEGMNVGADDFLTKPLDPDALRAHLIAATRVTSLHRQLAEQRSDLERLNREVSTLARQDPLTGLGNRRILQEDLEVMEARATRYGHSYTLALIDVDHFKSYNDKYGHQAGDHALQAVATQLKNHARRGDAVYRYGGDEFLCVLPEQSLLTGSVAVERMRAGVEQLAVPHSVNGPGVVTFSAGMAVLRRHGAKSVGEVLKEADEALYRAKQRGGNCVELLAAQPV